MTREGKIVRIIHIDTDPDTTRPCVDEKGIAYNYNGMCDTTPTRKDIVYPVDDITTISQCLLSFGFTLTISYAKKLISFDKGRDIVDTSYPLDTEANLLDQIVEYYNDFIDHSQSAFVVTINPKPYKHSTG